MLDKVGLPRPQETEIGIDLRYATALFEIPPSAPRKWRAVLHRPGTQTGRGGLLVPVKSNRWQVNLTQMHGQPVPESPADFVAFARTLRTQTIHDAIKGAVPVGPIYRFGFPGSLRRTSRGSKLPRLSATDRRCDLPVQSGIRSGNERGRARRRRVAAIDRGSIHGC